MATRRLRRTKIRITRDLILFWLGVGVIVNETLLRDAEIRVAALAIGGVMCGLPGFLGLDERRAAAARSSTAGSGPPSPSEDS